MEIRDEDRHFNSGILIEELDRLRSFKGPPAQFWPTFMEKARLLVDAHAGFLLAQAEGDNWKYLLIWPEKNRAVIKTPGLTAKIEELAQTSLANRSAWTKNGHFYGGDGDGLLVGVRLGVDGERYGVAVFLLDQAAKRSAEEAIVRLSQIADTPGAYQLGRLLGQAKADVGRFSDGLDLMVLLNEKKNYVAAAMTFCNEVASRYRFDRVSLGWLKGRYMRVQAISHMERFDRKMDVVQDLEAVMEEAIDQDEEILWPRPEGTSAITRNHEAFAKRAGITSVVSIPIRLDGERVGALTCERSGEALSEAAVPALRLLCDLAARRLGDLQERDRWLGARVASTLRGAAARLVGVENTFAKIAVIVLLGVLAYGVFGTLNYRVEAPFIVKSDDVVYVSAPFDGFIDQVNVDLGDVVEQGDLLLRFDTRELLLEEAAALANQIRFEREAERYRAGRSTADMMIAQAQADQARSRLDLVRYQLRNAEIKAPNRGVVVEGDLKELRGTPARKGDVLFKLALTENLYAQLEIDERDSHELSAEATGEISFLSRPDLEFPIQVERVDPVALTREERNVFTVRAGFATGAEPWWRPGMSGIAKVNVGRRNVLWILTHRTIDFLRMYLWW